MGNNKQSVTFYCNRLQMTIYAAISQTVNSPNASFLFLRGIGLREALRNAIQTRLFTQLVPSMSHEVVTVTFLVREYDEAIEFFTNSLRYTLLEDTVLSAQKRWVVVAPEQGRLGSALLLAKATTPEQVLCVGKQAGGRVFLFLHTPDFLEDFEHMESSGVHFIEAPRSESYGKVVVFQDLYGNKWDLLERRAI